MGSINARERGQAAFNRGKTRQPMNDVQFVKLMYEAVAESNEVPRTIKAYYILEWKGGWDETKAKAEKPIAKKKAKKKSKIIRKRRKK